MDDPGRSLLQLRPTRFRVCLKLAKDLRTAVVKLWIDRLDIRPGAYWDQAVESALESCSQLLVILSPASVESKNVMDEVAFARISPTICTIYDRDEAGGCEWCSPCGTTSNGSEEEIGSGPSVNNSRAPSQTSSASRIWISTCGRDEEENPVNSVTEMTSKATVPRNNTSVGGTPTSNGSEARNSS